MSMQRPGWVAALMLVALGSASAQEPTDVDFAADESRSAADAEADPEFDAADEAISGWRPLFDLRARSDQVSGLPGGRADMERLRFRTRFGAAWDRGGSLGIGTAVRASQGSDSNRDNPRNNDNERSNHIGLDQAWLHWRVSERTRLEFGKTPLPLALTPLSWDDDLRPIGASWAHTRDAGEFDRWQWDVGVFKVDHPLADGPRLIATQFGWHWHEGAPTSFSAIAGYLAFDRIDPLARAGLGRGNPVKSARYVDDYRLLDLQLALRRRPGARGRPLEVRLDLLRNLAAERSGDAARFSLIWGDASQADGWELGYAYQRIQAAAALAAVNSDDWWFHAGARGHTVTVEYGISDAWSLRLAGFSETRDGLDQRTSRLLVDVLARW